MTTEQEVEIMTTEQEVEIKLLTEQVEIITTEQVEIMTTEQVEIKLPTAENVFTEIYDKHVWGNGSGHGSSFSYNIKYITMLSKLFKELNIKSITDIGCGYWEFSQYVNFDGINYLGLDVVKSVIDRNNVNFKRENINFKLLNVIESSHDIEMCDLIIIKDVLQHFPNQTVVDVINNVKDKCKYLLVVNCSFQSNENDIVIGSWRPLSYQMYPLNTFKFKLIGHYNTKDICLLESTGQSGTDL